MAMERPAKPSTQSEEIQASQPSEELVKAICKWVGLLSEHFRVEISEAAMVGYIEGLKDLKSEQLQFCCERTLKELSWMPKVADIRERLYDTNAHNRPDYLDEEPLSEEERTAASVFSQKLKETLIKMDEESRRPVPRQEISSYFPIYHEAYLLWLKEQELLDEQTRMAGGTPIPRSNEERLAIFYNLPLAERKRLRRKAEWTKVTIKIT